MKGHHARVSFRVSRWAGQGSDLHLDHLRDVSEVKFSVKSGEQSSELPLQFPRMPFIVIPSI